MPTPDLTPPVDLSQTISQAGSSDLRSGRPTRSTTDPDSDSPGGNQPPTGPSSASDPDPANEPPPPELPPGFRFIRRLGRGGMGEVYEVEKEQIQTRYAMKMIRASRFDSVLFERFRRVHEVDESGASNVTNWGCGADRQK